MENIDKPTNMRLNEKLADLLGKLYTIMTKRGDNIRARTYKRAQETVMGITTDITDIEQLRGKPGIGPTIMAKFHEYMNTGKLELIEREKENPENIFNDIYGVGPMKAKELVAIGVKSIADLRKNQDKVLNDVQKVGLKYYEDILERIPRTEIQRYNEVFEKGFETVSIDNDAKYEIVGSYRRGEPSSGDIDVIVTCNNPKVFVDFIDLLIKQEIIIEVLSRGATKSLVIAKLPGMKHARRVDFLYSSPKEFAFAILYFTGSKAFNTVMRGHALKMGYSLNEHGMSKMVDKKKGEPVTDMFSDEKDIFDFLNLVYKEPVERINGNAVQIKPATAPSIVASAHNKLTPVRRTIKIKAKPMNVPVPIPIPTNTVVEIPKPILVRKTRKAKPTIDWNKTSENKDCSEICEEKGLQCDQSKWKLLDNEENLALIMSKLGEKCDTFEKVEVVHHAKNNTCYYFDKTSKKRFTQKSCSRKGTKTDVFLCPCSPLTKTKKEKEKKKNSPKTLKVKEVKEKKVRIKVPRAPKEEKALKTRKNIKTKLQIPIAMANPPTNNQYFIEEFKVKGISVLEQLPENTLVEMIKETNDAYYNTGFPLLTDNEFDILKEYVERKYPKNNVLSQIGAPVGKNKVNLPYEMASMDKIKPDSNALANWTNKYIGPYVLSCKLDGVSGMYSTEGDVAKLYTRGDGKVGQDISHFIEVLQLPKHKGYVVRGEFIMPIMFFENKYKDQFANPRNLVAGIINSKTIDEKIKDIRFVAYEIINPPMKPSMQMEKLNELGHVVVMNTLMEKLSNEVLSETLLNWRKEYEYQIDGVIVANDAIYPRKSGNPDNAFAFKMLISDQKAEVKVVDVIWSPSKSGYLKPRVRIEPLKLGGVTIEYATGINAKFIQDNRIGIGAIIEIVRSGDVIPKINAVKIPAEVTKMPDVPYIWNETNVDIMIENSSEDPIVIEKNITAFFVGIGVEGLSSGNVRRIITKGFDTIPKILHMSKSDFENIEGFKEKMVEKLYQGIRERLNKISLVEFMAASNMFGRGLSVKKIEPIMTTFPSILVSPEPLEEKVKMLKTIKGIGEENAKGFVSHIAAFMIFLNECYPDSTPPFLNTSTSSVKNGEKNEQNDATNIDTTNPLYRKKIVMTKVRDKAIIDESKLRGFSIDDSMHKDTFVLIVKAKDVISNKTKYAVENNIPIMTPDEFKDAYMK
jgi:DNA ligase (NAD+)